jgi:hypothetical protein
VPSRPASQTAWPSRSKARNQRGPASAKFERLGGLGKQEPELDGEQAVAALREVAEELGEGAVAAPLAQPERARPRDPQLVAQVETAPRLLEQPEGVRPGRRRLLEVVEGEDRGWLGRRRLARFDHAGCEQPQERSSARGAAQPTTAAEPATITVPTAATDHGRARGREGHWLQRTSGPRGEARARSDPPSRAGGGTLVASAR